MTVCVGAICDGGEAYVACSDEMLTLEGSGTFVSADEMGLKLGGIHKHWIAMYSGSSSLAVPILEEAKGDFGCDDSLIEVSQHFLEIYTRHLTNHVSQKILSPFGWTRDQFYREGLRLLGEAGFLQVRTDFEYAMRTDPALDFLVLGRASDNKMHVFSISNPGVLHYHDNQSFWAIGIGQSLALGSLMMAGHSALFQPETSVYRVLEAKFIAEKAPGVGKRTNLVYVDFRLPLPYLGFFWNATEAIKTEWEADGRPRMADKAIEKIRLALAKQSASQTSKDSQ